MTVIAAILALAAVYYLTHKGSSQNLVGFAGFCALVLFGGLVFVHVADTWTPQTPGQMVSGIAGLVKIALWCVAAVAVLYLGWAVVANYLWDDPVREGRRRYAEQVRREQLARQQAAIYAKNRR